MKNEKIIIETFNVFTGKSSTKKFETLTGQIAKGVGSNKDRK